MKTLRAIFVVLLTLLTAACWGQPTSWQSLSDGLEYVKLQVGAGAPSGVIHAFRIDPQFYQLKLAFLRDSDLPSATVANLAKTNHAVIATNGGFFSPDLRPLGLRINQGEQKNPLKGTTWWGVFLIKDGKAEIVSQKNYKFDKSIEFAIQSGPRLLTNGKIPTLKGGLDNRTALCITHDQKIILLATENLPISTYDLAKVLRQPSEKGGLGCFNALNLDGGSSTQLYAQINKFRLQVSGFTFVSDAVLVVPRNHLQ